MHNNIFNYCQIVYIKNMSHACICRTNNVAVRPCKEISRTSLNTLIVLFLPKSLNILHGLFLADHLDEFDVENEGAVGRDIA